MDLFEMMMQVEANVLKSKSSSEASSLDAVSCQGSNDSSQQSSGEFISAKCSRPAAYSSPKKEKLKPRNRSVRECGADKLVWANNPWFKHYTGKLGKFFPARICNDQEGAVVAIDPKYWPIPEDRVLIQYICPPLLSNEYDVLEKKEVFPYYHSKDTREPAAEDAEKVKKSTKLPTVKPSQKCDNEIWNKEQVKNLYLLLSPHGAMADVDALMDDIIAAMDMALDKAKKVDLRRAEINGQADAEDERKVLENDVANKKRKRGRPSKVQRGDGDVNENINSQTSVNSTCSDTTAASLEPVVDLLALARQNRSDCGETGKGDWVLRPGDWIAYEHLVFKSVTVYSQIHRMKDDDSDSLLLMNGDVINPSEAIRKLLMDEKGKPLNHSGITKSLSKFKLRGFK